MKTIVVAILVLAFCLPVFAQEAKSGILDFAFELEAGYLPLNSWVLYNPTESLDYSGLTFYTGLKAELIFLNTFFIGGSVNSVFYKIEDKENRVFLLNFSPYEMYFGFNFGIRLSDNFEIGFIHTCVHPLITYLRSSDIDNRQLEGAFEKLYFKFKAKLNIL